MKKTNIGYKSAKMVSGQRYNKLQYLWRYHKKFRVRKKNYSILSGTLESK